LSATFDIDWWRGVPTSPAPAHNALRLPVYDRK